MLEVLGVLMPILCSFYQGEDNKENIQDPNKVWGKGKGKLRYTKDPTARIAVGEKVLYDNWYFSI